MTTRTLVQVAATGMLLLATGCASVDPRPPAAPALRTEPAPAQPVLEPDVKPGADPSAADGAPYACDNGVTVRARIREDTLTLSGLAHGEETLLRDAGGVTPEQTVWANDRLRAEFGLPPAGQGAVLHLLQSEASTLHCQRQ